MIEVRYFAAAADAAGTDRATVEAAPSDTIASLMGRLGAGNEALERVLAHCTYLVDGARAERDQRLGDARTVDVLPPFAGG